jgi:hypothetical protein
MVARIAQSSHKRQPIDHSTDVQTHKPFTGDITHKNGFKNGPQKGEKKSSKIGNKDKKKNVKIDDVDMCGVCLVALKVSYHLFMSHFLFFISLFLRFFGIYV